MAYTDDQMVKTAKALSDENRLRILAMLKTGEKCACVLLDEMKISQPTLSHHMKILCDAGLVAGRKEGRWVHYSIDPNAAEEVSHGIRERLKLDSDREETSACPCGSNRAG